MKLSVIIVNYNVKHFLEQCLHAVRKASAAMPTEVFVVDNNSVDGSVEMVREKFPEVKLISNTENKGFSSANNQAILKSTGEYILLLNPDTLVEEDTFSKTITFMDSHPDAGGLGVKMVDGKGNFLPESKRGLPTPSVAFYKIFGLARIFPKSKTFGQYHLGFLDKNKIHEVEILSGAFMLMRKSALDKTGLLDETFFMYGEDIDLSYRLILAGYKNYYFPETRIIHYKGESTKKSSINYVFVFYNAMAIFAQKHFSQKNAKLFSLLINLAIYIRAALALCNRFVKWAILPGADIFLTFTGFYFIKTFYEQRIKFPDGIGSYPDELMYVFVPSYIAIWLISVYFAGGYDRPLKLIKSISGLFIGTGLILIGYALLPESARSSRALILIGAVWAIIALVLTRILLHIFKINGYTLDTTQNKKIIIVGSETECKRVEQLIAQTSIKPSFIYYVSTIGANKNNPAFIGSIDQLHEIVSVHEINEVIFCAQDVSAHIIIDCMSGSDNKNLNYKIAPPESLSIIGSNSINTSGDIYVIDINSINKPVNKRNKRLIDFGICLLLILLYPLNLFLVKKPIHLLRNIFHVFIGKKSWVGYGKHSNTNALLPKIKPGIVSQSDVLKDKPLTEDLIQRLNLLYAKDYNVLNDLNIILKSYKKLGD